MKTDMQAMVIHHYGKGPVSLERMPLPSMSPYEVRVKIKAASINPIDFKIRDGGLKMLLTYQFPLILGNDFAGEVYEVGDKVTQFKVGDKVYGRPRKSKIGTFAEYISVNAEEIAPMPKGLYVATTGSDSGKELIESLNPDEFINYKEQDFSEVLKDFDGVFDTLGGENLEKSFQILKPHGIIASISGLPTERNARKLDKSIFKRGILKAASYKYQRLAKKYDVQYEFLFMHPSGQQLREITELIEVGKIKPIIDKVYDFKETQKALEYSESGRAKGKIIVKMEDE